MRIGNYPYTDHVCDRRTRCQAEKFKETLGVKNYVELPIAIVVTLGLLLVTAGCDKSEKAAVADNPALATPVPEGMVRGTVLETMDSGGYTYVLVETDQDQRWAAAQQTAVSVGDVVQMGAGAPMAGFTSKTLDRSFDVLYFIDGLQNLSAPAGAATQGVTAMPEGHPATGMPPGHPSVDAAGVAPAADNSVAALEPGRDIAWVYANKDELAGQQVSLRGKVVKYNEGILGWNFIHLQDGSGEAGDGSNDMTITSKATTAVGETIVVTGTVILDKDFGAGYAFPTMIEDATIAAE
jgi:hypothetical protein